MFEGNAALSTVIDFPTPTTSDNPVEVYRQKAHEAMDVFVDEMAPYLCSHDPLDLEGASNLVQEKRSSLLGSLLQAYIEVHYGDVADQDQACCPQCRETLKAQKKKRNRNMETLQGEVRVERSYFHCRKCSVSFSPLDVALNLSRNKKQYDVQRKGIELAADIPFERTSRHFYNLTGITYSDHCLHETLKEFVDDLPACEVLPGEVQIEQSIEKAQENSVWRPILVVTTDGAMTPIRPQGSRKEKRGPGEWKEAKGFRVYLINQDRIIHIASWHQISETEQMGEVLQEMARRIPQDRVRIALVGDGASWLWNLMTQAFPTGRQILDVYHCSERVHGVARLQYEDDEQKRHEWVLATMVRLYYGKTADVIGGLRRMKPHNKAAQEEIRKLVGYLKRNKERIHYRSDRIGGYPIGSGAIESANKYICHLRLKRNGSWWLKENGNGMLRLRCAIFNDTFHQAFSNYTQRQKERRFATNA